MSSRLFIVLMTVCLFADATRASALDLASDRGRKLLKDAAQELRGADPDVASDLDDLAERGQTVETEGEKRPLSETDVDTLERAATDLEPIDHGLSKKLGRAARRAAKGLRSRKGLPLNPGPGIVPSQSINRSQGTQPDQMERQ